jgi:nitrite reductase/ring-hydroxylating ferredoxin subunit
MSQFELCNDDLKDGEMREVLFTHDDGLEYPVLLVKKDGEVTALGAKCTHYAAPLAKGVFCKGIIRCPWHGACFNAKTGDIEDFPGLDSLPVYPVMKDKGKVIARIRRTIGQT